MLWLLAQVATKLKPLQPTIAAMPI